MTWFVAHFDTAKLSKWGTYEQQKYDREVNNTIMLDRLNLMRCTETVELVKNYRDYIECISTIPTNFCCEVQVSFFISLKQTFSDTFLYSAEDSRAAEFEKGGELLFGHGAVGVLRVGSGKFMNAVDNSVGAER